MENKTATKKTSLNSHKLDADELEKVNGGQLSGPVTPSDNDIKNRVRTPLPVESGYTPIV